ncbi:MAG: glycosyltransferase [Cytophagales bacterium]|nr:glycosyltransferase [Cytophagales bacterium]
MIPFLTIITPTIGRSSLNKLIDSIESQTIHAATHHLVMWDDYRTPGASDPLTYNSKLRQSIVLNGNLGKNGDAPGSPLRAIGLMAANTPWVTFADDDVWWDRYHVEKILEAIDSSKANWGSTHRHIWQSESEYIGVDRFESVGDSASRAVPYEMCDGNTMVFRRELGVMAAHLYRNTTNYDDDRLMYSYLKANGGQRASIESATIHQICPEKLIPFFKSHCSGN